MKAWLSQKGIPYDERDVSQDQAAAYEMIRKSQQQGVPVVDIEGQIVVGFDRRRLEMIVAESTVRPALGAAVADAVRILKAKGLPGQSGAYVGRVTPGSPAAALGLHPGDIVTRLTGRPVNTADDLLQIMAQAERGMRLDMTYVRDGIAHDASVVL